MFQTEIKKCQNCKKEFIIEPEDFAFYAKIKVPPPTFCPECRLIRRLMFRNGRAFYKRKCDLCKEDIITSYHKDSPYTVFCHKCWWADRWDSMEYGKEYNFNKSFFEQFNDLMVTVPRMSIIGFQNYNSPYNNILYYSKNCYLCFNSQKLEDCMYMFSASGDKDCLDCYSSFNNELNYYCIDCLNCSKCFFSKGLLNCREVIYSLFCRNCFNCFGCVNLRDKSFYIFNEYVGKDKYFEIINQYNLREDRVKILQKLNQVIDKSIFKYNESKNCANCTGDRISHSKNLFNSFDIVNAENCKYIIIGVGDEGRIQDCMDCYILGSNQLTYECFNVAYSYNAHFGETCERSRDLIYCNESFSSSSLFGCVGLRNKQYCILNKQYTKEEYEKLVPKIIKHMNEMPYIDKKGRVYKYGEFFPSELSPFAYNETIAQEYFPLTKEQVLEQGYSWKEPEERDIKIDIKSDELPDNIHPPKFCKAKLGRVKDVKDDIIGKVIECAHQGKCNEQCTTAFKIIEPELQFYRRMNLPLPRLCPNCRHYQRLKQRNPLKLWHRKCQCAGNQSENGVYKNTIKHFHGDQPCPNEFETTYAPDRPEIVYCEKCYLAEVV